MASVLGVQFASSQAGAEVGPAAAWRAVLTEMEPETLTANHATKLVSALVLFVFARDSVGNSRRYWYDFSAGDCLQGR